MAIENTRESARLASNRMVLGSNSSQQPNQRLGRALPIYTRPDAVRSSSTRPYENSPGSYNGNRQDPIYENLRGSGYANTPESAPPLPPRAWIDPNRSNNARAGVYPSSGAQVDSVRPGLGYLPVNNPIGQAGYPIGSYGVSNTPGPNGFTSRPFDFPQGAAGLQQRIAELQRNGLERGLYQGNPAPANAQPTFWNPIAGNAAAVQSNSATAQATQRFGNSPPMQAYNNVQSAESHIYTRQSQPYRSQQSQYYDPQQGRNYGSQENRNYDMPQAQYYDPQQGQNYGLQQSRNYGSQQGQYYDPQQGGNYGSQQSSNYGSQQGQNYTSRPFSSSEEYASYQVEVERLMSNPNRTEISVPYGTPIGLFTTPAGSGIEFGRMQPGTTEFKQFPVGITSFGTSPYGSQNAQQVPPNQAQRDSPVIIRL